MKQLKLIATCFAASMFLLNTCTAKTTKYLNTLTGVVEYTASIDSYPDVRKQDDTMKCWAASIQMIFAHYGHEVDQDKIVERIKGINVNQGGFPIEMTQALSSEWTDQNGKSFISQCRIFDLMGSGAHQFNNNDIIAELAANRPLLYCTTHHAMVLVSVKWIEPTSGQKMPIAGTVIDPWPASADVRPLEPMELQPAFAATVKVQNLSDQSTSNSPGSEDSSTTPSEPPIEKPVSDNLLKKTKEIAKLLKEEDYDAIFDKFGDDLKARLPAETIKKTMAQISAQTGTIQSVGSPKRKPQGTGVIYGESLCTTANGHLLVQVQFNSDEEIVGLMVYIRN